MIISFPFWIAVIVFGKLTVLYPLETITATWATIYTGLIINRMLDGEQKYWNYFWLLIYFGLWFWAYYRLSD